MRSILVVYNDRMLKNAVILILIILLVTLSGGMYYLYTSMEKAAGTPEAREEAAALVAEVGKLIVLPEGETPTIATVSDPERLRDQPFFVKAKAGDKVLLYSQAKRAYLYDPVANKLLEVAPLNIGAEAGTQ